MQKEAVEDREWQTEDCFLIAYTILQKSITKCIFYDIDEFLAVKESGSWFLYNCQDKF